MRKTFQPGQLSFTFTKLTRKNYPEKDFSRRNFFSFATDSRSLSRFQAGLSFYRIKLAILFPPAVSSPTSCSQYTSVRAIVRQNSSDLKRIALCMRRQTFERDSPLLLLSLFHRKSDYSIESEASAFNAVPLGPRKLASKKLRLRGFYFVLSRLFLATSGNYIFINVTPSRQNRIGNKNVSFPCYDLCDVQEPEVLSYLLNDLNLLSYCSMRFQFYFRLSSFENYQVSRKVSFVF